MHVLLSSFIVLSAAAFAKQETIRVGFASQDFGNWHFCGTRDLRKPFCEAGDVLQGFNAEISEEIFKRLGVAYTPVFKRWDSNAFLEGLNNNEYDVLISNVGFREHRKVYGIFSSQPYEALDALPDYHFFSKKAEQFTLRKIGVLKDSLLHSFLLTLFKPEALTLYSGSDKLMDGLLTDQVDAVFASFSGYKEWICANEEIVKLTSIPTSLNVNGMSDDTYILTTHRMPELAKKMDEALSSMHSDGTINKLFDKWIREKPSCQK